MSDRKDVSLTDSFNAMSARMQSSATLGVYNAVNWVYYDFAQRLLMTAREGGFETTPFAQLDREVLVAARDKLVELGGKPPALPAEAPGLNKQLRGLNP